MIMSLALVDELQVHDEGFIRTDLFYKVLKCDTRVTRLEPFKGDFSFTVYTIAFSEFNYKYNSLYLYLTFIRFGR